MTEKKEEKKAQQSRLVTEIKDGLVLQRRTWNRFIYSPTTHPIYTCIQKLG